MAIFLRLTFLIWCEVEGIKICSVVMCLRLGRRYLQHLSSICQNFWNTFWQILWRVSPWPSEKLVRFWWWSEGFCAFCRDVFSSTWPLAPTDPGASVTTLSVLCDRTTLRHKLYDRPKSVMYGPVSSVFRAYNFTRSACEKKMSDPRLTSSSQHFLDLIIELKLWQ